MNYENLKKKLEGCYVTVPTPFKDINNLPLNFDALKDYVEFLLGNGLDRKIVLYFLVEPQVIFQQ
ncbi:MAG: hypothetical protein CM1200mP30_17160 [Pseudomonadota bacterium]|nr:MAG: hypothetical protein CM1200mP30_17160 [Pseudomonadota bacterium]